MEIQQSNTPPKPVSIPARLPNYDLQLADVFLYQMNIERASPFFGDVEEATPDYEWNVDINPTGQANRRSARVRIDYRWPSASEVSYVIVIELVGIFIGTDIAADTQILSKGPRQVQAQLPLNDYTVISLLWPYAREILHQMQMRMRVPISLLPTLDLANLRSVEDIEQQP